MKNQIRIRRSVSVTTADNKTASRPGARRSRFVAAVSLFLALLPLAPEASTWNQLPGLCEAAAARASSSTGVPLSVLRAITLTETGRSKKGSFRPWPWTVNMEGKGVWFDTLDEAKAYVRRNHDRGARSYDVGCFQINYRWHGGAFSSVDEMFDPDANAFYAARFLRQLFAEYGDWSRAAGAYHSRTPKFAEKYSKRFDRIRERLRQDELKDGAPVLVAAVEGGAGGAPAAVAKGIEDPIPRRVPRDNRFPLLLQTGNDRGLASLVPLEIAAGTRLIDVDPHGGG